MEWQRVLSCVLPLTSPEDVATVADNQEEIPKYTTVICAICNARLHPQPREAAWKMKCPDCFEPVRVPPLAAVMEKLRQQRAVEEKRKVNVGTYDLALKVDAEEKLPDSVRIVCAVCNALLHPDLKTKAHTISCPDCHEPIQVPALSDVPIEKRNRPKKRRSRSTGLEAETTIDLTQHRVRPTEFSEVQAEMFQVEKSPPPKWTFFSGVYSFPMYEGARSRWIYLSIGYIVVGLLLSFFVTSAMTVASTGYGGVVLGFFALPLIWLATWTGSYAAACGLAVLVETAAGNDQIAGWPEPIWKEWAARLIYLAFVAMPLTLVASLVAKLSELVGLPPWSFFLGTFFFLYPIFLLSSLEANSPWIPITKPILATLVDLWWGWIVFYLSSAVLISGYVAFVYFGSQLMGGLTMILSGPLAAALVFIEARLLGRLAWRASHDPTENSKNN
jgi:DNA-directed RNA polymerase subunit M/transcription elongation factor TFIIS